MTIGAKRQQGSSPLLEAIEDQVLYSADALGGLDVASLTIRDESIIEGSLLPGRQSQDNSGAEDSLLVPDQQVSVVPELVFVDTDTVDYQLLVDDLLKQRNDERQFDVFILDNSRNGIEQISEVLASHESLDVVHIISHGTDGSIDIGASSLNLNTLESASAVIAEWGEAFDDTGDLLIYGCDLAASSQGQGFVSKLAQITGIDVAASVDTTGSAVLGGNWDLEYHDGDIEGVVALGLEGQQSWAGVLAADITRVSWGTGLSMRMLMIPAATITMECFKITQSLIQVTLPT